MGVEGEVFLGGITAAYIGINWTFLPAPILLVTCFLGAMAVGAAWAFIPGFLKAEYGVNEVCVTILMNSVAQYIASYLVSGPMSAGVANSQSLPVTVTLPKFLKPSNANAGMFIAILTVIFIGWMLKKTTFGYKVRTVGTNPVHAEYTGMKPKKVLVQTCLLDTSPEAGQGRLRHDHHPSAELRGQEDGQDRKGRCMAGCRKDHAV